MDSRSIEHDFSGAAQPYGDATLHDNVEIQIGSDTAEPTKYIKATSSSESGGSEGSSQPPRAKCGPLAKVSRWTSTVVPPGGHLSNIFNISSATLGIGIVSMASGFNTAGIGLSTILMVICGLCVVFSFYLIGRTCERSPYRSWESAARHLLCPGVDYFVAALMIVLQYGGMISYVISAHDLLTPFVEGDDVNPFLRTPNGRRLLTATVWFFGMLLLTLPRKASSLRYFSIIGVTLVVYFVIAVIVHSCQNKLPHLHEMKIFSKGIDAVNGLSLFIFAFLGHGLCFRLFDEMQKPTAKNLAIDSASSVSLVGVLYYLVGFFGYAEIGPTISGSIFQYYSVRNDAMMCVAYIGILIKVCVAFALANQACRLPIFYILRRNLDTVPYWQLLCINLFLCVSTLVFGMFIPDVTIVFNLLGSICGGFLAFIFPAFFVMYLGGWTFARVGWLRMLASYFLLIAGVVAIVWGTAVTVDGLIDTYGNGK